LTHLQLKNRRRHQRKGLHLHGFFADMKMKLYEIMLRKIYFKSFHDGFCFGLSAFDGTMQQGIIVSQTSNAIVVNKQGGVKTTIAKKDIKSLKTLDMSPMPNDFEKRIDKQQMADLIAFIKAPGP